MKIVLLDEAQERFAAEDRWWREHRDAKELFVSRSVRIHLVSGTTFPKDVAERALAAQAKESAEARRRDRTRWFATRAAITPRTGGQYTISWDGAWEWDFQVDDWQPGQRLRIVDRRARPFHGDGQRLQAIAPAEIVIEFTLAAVDQGAGTRLRIVHSGFGQGAAWDDEIDGVTHGWNGELRGLRHYLEHHRGQPRTMVWVSAVVDAPIDDVWQRLTRPGGFMTSDHLRWLHGGDRLSAIVAGGERISGTALLSIPGRVVVMSAEQYENGLFRLHVDRAGAKTMVFTGLSAWGPSAMKVDRFRPPAKQALADTLAVEIA